MNTQSEKNGYKPGLEGVVAAETRLSLVDGQQGRLIIAGFPVEALANQASFEEVVYLLWHDRLPNAAELDAFCQQLTALRPLPTATQDLLTAVAAARTPPMDALRMAAGTLNLGVESEQQAALALVARLPIIVSTYWRRLHHQPILAPRADLGHAANFLYLLHGQPPDPAQVRGLETYLNTVVDHGLNASTFAARVIIATQSDMVSAIVGAIGALKGALHGGAPGPALELVFEIGTAERADAYLRAKLAAGERLMGFGHRIYKVRDPRAEILATAAEQMYRNSGDMALYELAKTVEQTAVALLAEYKPGRNLQTNVEFYTALLLHGLGLDTALFTPTFALGRVAGWIGHCLEQQQNGRLIRPQSRYIGEENRTWTTLAQRP